MNRNVVNIALIVLAVIGAIALLGVIGMWLMSAGMMGGVMMGSGMTAVGCGIGGLLFIGLIVAAVAVLLSHRKPLI